VRIHSLPPLAGEGREVGGEEGRVALLRQSLKPTQDKRPEARKIENGADEKIGNHGDVLESIALSLEDMVDAGQQAEEATGEGSWQPPRRQEKTGQRNASERQICEAEFASENQRSSFSQSQDDVCRVSGLKHLAEAGQRKTSADRPKAEPLDGQGGMRRLREQARFDRDRRQGEDQHQRRNSRVVHGSSRQPSPE